MPLGTGNDLARVLGWGAVLDDDNQLPKLLESFERATTKMLDRWSIMTYDSNNNITTPITCNNSAIPANPTIATSMTASTNNISKSSNNLNAKSTIPQL